MIVDPPHILNPPAWVARLIGGSDGEWEPAGHGLACRRIHGLEFALTSVRVANALSMDETTFRQFAEEGYSRVYAETHGSRHRHLVRVWNFIPDILGPLGELPQRYMVFNAARFAAYQSWYGDRNAFPQVLATASGVGHQGTDLVIHALAATAPGAPVENPRQVPSYRYSSRFGPLPPCFSRAVRLDPNAGRRGWLLVGGTASIRGQETLHLDDLHQQIEETLANLAALVASSSHLRAPTGTLGRELLDRFIHLRTYYRVESERTLVEAAIAESFRGTSTSEILHAVLCRPGLRVEIEGVAEL